ncbi:hypothetical protein WA158_000712 [Blastocystis sp. Blastoise]
MFSLVSMNTNDFIEEEKSYCIDLLSLSIHKMIPFMENAEFLDVLSSKDLISIYSDIHYFFGDESYEDKIKIYTFLWDSLNNFIVNNKYLITEERNELFCQYSPLFDFFSITIVTLKFDFSEDIPYEYIYHSNLHELFQN